MKYVVVRITQEGKVTLNILGTISKDEASELYRKEVAPYISDDVKSNLDEDGVIKEGKEKGCIILDEDQWTLGIPTDAPEWK